MKNQRIKDILSNNASCVKHRLKTYYQTISLFEKHREEGISDHVNAKSCTKSLKFPWIKMVTFKYNQKILGRVQ